MVLEAIPPPTPAFTIDLIVEDGLSESRFNPLTQESIQQIERIFNAHPKNLVIDMYNISITVETIQCLKPSQWIDDEVINFFKTWKGASKRSISFLQ
mmetsp:Transcript_13374/g.22406  ORF Transcript_13374/g.22406 Transcript_13374/m.22406 type:complete len:97 (+) Transcript_13374:41-331(+)